MNWKNTDHTYGLTARGLHWITAIIVLGLLSMGFYMHALEASPFKFRLYGLHKSLGLLVLLLAGLRLGWRLINKAPSTLDSHRAWEKHLSKIIHMLLYVSLIGMPLSGWIMSSAGGFSVSFFGLFEMPAPSGKNEALFKLMREIHEIFAYGLMGALALHIIGALKHHIIDQDETLTRMGGNVMMAAFGIVLLTLPIAVIGQQILTQKQESTDITKSLKKPQSTPGETSGGSAENYTEEPGAPIWTINHEESHIGFSITQYGTNVEGHFESFDGLIVFDPDTLKQSRVRICINAESLKTGSEERDAQGKSEAWLHTKKFPTILFESNSFERRDSNHYLARGRLTVRGVTMALDLPFSLDISTTPEKTRLAVMHASATLNRLDFGVGQGQWEDTDEIGDTVTVDITLQASRPADKAPG